LFNFLGGLFVLIAVLTWSIASIVYKSVLGSVGDQKKYSRDPLASLGIRILILSAFILLYNLSLGNINKMFITMNTEQMTLYFYITILCGFLTAIGDICYFFALRYLDASRVYPLINTQTLFTIPFAYYFFNEQIPALMWISSFLMIIGVLFVGGTQDSKDKGMENLSKQQIKRNYIKGISCGIGTGFCFGTQYLAMTALNRIYFGVMEANMARVVSYAIILWIILLLKPNHIPRIRNDVEKKSFKSYILTGLIGIFSFGIGDAVYQLGVSLNGAQTSIIIASSAPIFNQAFSILVLKEKLRKNFLLGVFCIIVGNILVVF